MCISKHKHPKRESKEKLLILKEAAEHLRVSERSMYRYIKDGKLKATKVGYWNL